VPLKGPLGAVDQPGSYPKTDVMSGVATTPELAEWPSITGTLRYPISKCLFTA
jgi:hypothetical protein